jgi:hypothetical protein
VLAENPTQAAGEGDVFWGGAAEKSKIAARGLNAVRIC